MLPQALKRRFLPAVTFLLTSAAPLPAQVATEDVTALRDKAFQLWEQGNQIAALPLLEKLAVLKPGDVIVLERLGGALVASASQESDPEARKKIVLRARGAFLEAKRLGNDSGYVQIMLEQLPESGELRRFSMNREVDKAVSEGEAAFGKGDYAAALKAYERAYALDPTNYSAALFSGDVHFVMNQIDQAGFWFARAIQIDPNRETAYRYWADGLMKEGKVEEARAKFIEAVVAEPYIRAPWVNLKKWADRASAKLAPPRVEPKGSVTSKGGEITINIDPTSSGEDGGGHYWLVYPISRAAWKGEKFKKEFPNEKEYRHTLREEVEALAAVAGLVAADAKDPAKKKDIDPELLTLVSLHEQGLLEAYVLLSRADQGIAQDYAAYRAQHRDKLVRYISEWVISAEPAKK